eukprot:681197-Pleurochrysis_carterae.AAC.1
MSTLVLRATLWRRAFDCWRESAAVRTLATRVLARAAAALLGWLLRLRLHVWARWRQRAQRWALMRRRADRKASANLTRATRAAVRALCVYPLICASLRSNFSVSRITVRGLGRSGFRHRRFKPLLRSS